MLKEHIKTVILTVLIILSCFLTYKTWIYTPEFKSIDTTLSLPPMSSQGEVVSFKDTTRAYQAVHIKDNEEIGTMSKEFLDEFRDLFQGKEVTEVQQEQPINQLKSEALIESNEILIIDYYSEMPARTFLTMFEMDTDKDHIEFNFDRIILEMRDDDTILNLVTEDRTSFTSYKIDIPKSEIETVINNHSDLFIDYSMVISNAETSNRLTAIYGPKSPGKQKVHQFIPSTLSVSTMNETLFSSSDVEQKQSKDITVYESDTEIATYSANNYQYSFMNLKEADSNTLSPYRTIEKSFIFLNGHMGLTAKDILFDYDDEESTVIYKPMLNDYVVFSDEIMSEILVTVGKGTIAEYSRPMIQVNANIPSDLSTTLDDLEKVRYKIVIDENYDFSKVSKIILAYELKHNEDQSELNVVDYIPSWYILYDGEWVKYDIEDES